MYFKCFQSDVNIKQCRKLFPFLRWLRSPLQINSKIRVSCDKLCIPSLHLLVKIKKAKSNCQCRQKRKTKRTNRRLFTTNDVTVNPALVAIIHRFVNNKCIFYEYYFHWVATISLHCSHSLQNYIFMKC